MRAWFADTATKSLSRRERVARASGPGEGYRTYFFNVFSFLSPSPAAPRHPLPLGEGFAIIPFSPLIATSFGYSMLNLRENSRFSPGIRFTRQAILPFSSRMISGVSPQFVRHVAEASVP